MIWLCRHLKRRGLVCRQEIGPCKSGDCRCAEETAGRLQFVGSWRKNFAVQGLQMEKLTLLAD